MSNNNLTDQQIKDAGTKGNPNQERHCLMTMPAPNKAVIYCRVSDPKQVTRGSGLGSQETRCREYARAKGYEVVEVFRDEGTTGPTFTRTSHCAAS